MSAHYPNVPGLRPRHVFRLGLLVAFLALAPLGARAAPPAPTEPARVLKVSAAIDNYPYSYRDEHGRLTGYAVDMLDAVAEVMHVRLERTEVTVVEDIANYQSGHYDLGQFHSLPPGRTPAANFSQPILVNTGEVFGRTGDRRFASLEDLRRSRARVAVAQQGFDYLLARGFDPSRLRLATSADAVRALSSGTVDAALLTRLTGLTQAYYLRIQNIEPLGFALADFRVSFCITTRRGDDVLLQQINEALATLSTTGRTVAIYSRWFGRYETRHPSLREIVGPAAAVLAVALIVTLVLLRRQHLLRRHIAAQAKELQLSHEILAEAQRFAHLGHSRRPLAPGAPAEWSEEMYRIFELPPTAGVPSPAELVAFAVAADRPRWRAVLELTERGGPPYDLDITIETSTGRRKIINIRGRATFDASGRQDGTFGTAQDVTASRAAAAALQQSELLLRALYEHLPVALGVVEQRPDDWYVLSMNPEAMRQLGAASPPATGLPLAAIMLPPERNRFWREQFERSSGRKETVRFEFESERFHKWFATAIMPLVIPGQLPRCCMLSEEITARKLKDAELAQSRRLRAIGELVGGIAHEFNNLITPITLNTEVLLAQSADRPGLRDDLQLISDAARRAGELTRRLLTFGRRNDPRPEPVDLAAVVATNIALIRHTIDRRIALTSAVPDSLPALHLPAGDLQQILLNLILNARDALAEKLARAPAPGWSAQIEITAARLPATALTPFDPARGQTREGWIQLTVRDNGCGMTPATRERLFEPFFTTKDVGSGTGLGLATIWHLVKEFGGRIDVDSAPNEGTAFHLGLPLYAAGPAAPAQPAGPPPPAALAGRHFLLADDETSVLTVVTRLLERQGHRVTAVADGLAALRTLTADPAAFDAVIMDLNMPGLTGAELAARVRALAYHRPLLVMSGRISDEDRDRLLACGVDVLLDKPFTLTDFNAALARACGEPGRTAPAAG